MSKRPTLSDALKAAECECMRLTERLEAAERSKRHLEAERDQALRDAKSDRKHKEAHRQELLKVGALLCKIRDAARGLLEEYDSDTPTHTLETIAALRDAVEGTGKAPT